MDHAAAIRRIYELINAGDIDGFGGLLADDFVEHEALPGFPPDRGGVVAFFKTLRAGFPDMRMNPDDVLVDGDKAVARATTTGTHQGEFMGIPATGRHASWVAFGINRYVDGKMKEHWGLPDVAGIMRQLGPDQGAH